MILTLMENERQAVDAAGERWWKGTDGRWRRHGQVQITMGPAPRAEPETRFVPLERAHLVRA